MTPPDLPQASQPSSHQPVWVQFRLDPRTAPSLRLADGDRDDAREVLASAYSTGQLNHEEYLERLDQASNATNFGALIPLVSDLTLVAQAAPTLPVAATPLPPEPAPFGKKRGIDTAIDTVKYTALGVVSLNIAIWILVSISNASAVFFWPMWIMLGMAIPLMVLFIIRGATDTEQDQIDREARQRQRRAIKARRRQRRRELGH